MQALFYNEEDRAKEAMSSLVMNTLSSSVYIKNPAFSEEAEWRFYIALGLIRNYTDFYEAIEQLGIGKYFKELGVSTRGEKLIFYYDMLLNNLDPNLTKLPWIKEIILGPKCKLLKKDVKLLLEHAGWDTGSLEIVKSNATYSN